MNMFILIDGHVSEFEVVVHMQVGVTEGFFVDFDELLGHERVVVDDFGWLGLIDELFLDSFFLHCWNFYIVSTWMLRFNDP